MSACTLPTLPRTLTSRRGCLHGALRHLQYILPTSSYATLATDLSHFNTGHIELACSIRAAFPFKQCPCGYRGTGCRHNISGRNACRCLDVQCVHIGGALKRVFWGSLFFMTQHCQFGWRNPHVPLGSRETVTYIMQIDGTESLLACLPMAAFISYHYPFHSFIIFFLVA